MLAKLIVINSFLLILLNSFTCNAQEAFLRDTLFLECQINIPFTYLNSSVKSHLEFAHKYQNQELIRLNFSKSSDTITYARFFIVSEPDSTGIWVYLTSKKGYLKHKDDRLKLYPAFNLNFENYYFAECFDSIKNENQSLLSWIIEKEFF